MLDEMMGDMPMGEEEGMPMEEAPVGDYSFDTSMLEPEEMDMLSAAIEATPGLDMVIEKIAGSAPVEEEMPMEGEAPMDAGLLGGF